MVTPLHIMQTRHTRADTCATVGNGNPSVLRNYPAYNRSYLNYPTCTELVEDTSPFGPGGVGLGPSGTALDGFSYVPASAQTRGLAVSASDGRTHGPGGFILDVWRAGDYRAAVTSLVSNGWIDEKTDAIIIKFQLYNAQTSCHSWLTFLFERVGSGVIEPK